VRQRLDRARRYQTALDIDPPHGVRPAGPGAASRQWNSPHSNGWIGSTTAACSSRLATCHPPRLRPATMPRLRSRPWQRDSNQTASVKSGTVQFFRVMVSGTGSDAISPKHHEGQSWIMMPGSTGPGTQQRLRGRCHRTHHPRGEGREPEVLIGFLAGLSRPLARWSGGWPITRPGTAYRFERFGRQEPGRPPAWRRRKAIYRTSARQSCLTAAPVTRL
jgi:hypothetical protein